MFNRVSTSSLRRLVFSDFIKFDLLEILKNLCHKNGEWALGVGGLVVCCLLIVDKAFNIDILIYNKFFKKHKIVCIDS